LAANLWNSVQYKSLKMNERLKCFISASYETDTSQIKNILAECNVDTFDLYDLSIGESIQTILKRKIRLADFALFIISSENTNVIYEMGVCEGIGKQHFIIVEKDYNTPTYIENKLFIRANLHDKAFLKMSIQNILQAIEKNVPKRRKATPENNTEKLSYSNDVKEKLRSYRNELLNMRKIGHGLELEHVIEKVIKSIKLNYVKNSINVDKGVDFALWSDELGKIIGNPILIEVKYGSLSNSAINNAGIQLRSYIEKTDAKVAILIYLDKSGQRFKIQSSLNPLLIVFDAEDFVNDLLYQSFENLILEQRNKIAHGLE
jgi:hypothetical protein